MGRARSCALLIFLLAPDAVASPGGDTTDPDTVSTLAIDGRASRARFIVHMRMSMAGEGRLGGVSGHLRGSPAAGWRVQVKVNGRSLRFDGPRWMDRVTRSDAFLAVDRFPVIRFHSEIFPDAALREGGVVDGQLTLRGLTRPVSFQLLPSPCAHPGRECAIEVQGTLSRHAFGMSSHRALVRDNVDFRISVRLAEARVP